MPDNIDPKCADESPIIDPSGRIKTAEEIATTDRAEQNRREQDCKRQLLDAETRQANAQHSQAAASRAIVILTGGLVIVSLISGFVSYLLFKVADRNAKTAEDQAFITALTVGQTQHMIGQAIEQTRAAQESATTATESLKANVRISRMDQRAWIGVSLLTADPESIHVDGKAYVSVDFRNTGKTPARNVTATVAIDPGNPPHFSYVGVNHVAYGLLPPNGESHVKVSIVNTRITRDEAPLTAELFRLIMDKKVRPSIHGYVIYEDIFAISHWMTFCYFIDAADGPVKFAACHQHNDTGEGRIPRQD